VFFQGKAMVRPNKLVINENQDTLDTS